MQELFVHEAKIAVDDMKAVVPVDTGRLKRNIFWGKTRNNEVFVESEAIDPNGGYDYAPIIEEYGGRYSKGKHYFRDIINRMKSRLLRSVEDGIVNIIKGTKGRLRVGPGFRRGGTFDPAK